MNDGGGDDNDGDDAVNGVCDLVIAFGNELLIELKTLIHIRSLKSPELLDWSKRPKGPKRPNKLNANARVHQNFGFLDTICADFTFPLPKLPNGMPMPSLELAKICCWLEKNSE